MRPLWLAPRLERSGDRCRRCRSCGIPLPTGPSSGCSPHPRLGRRRSGDRYRPLGRDRDASRSGVRRYRCTRSAGSARGPPCVATVGALGNQSAPGSRVSAGLRRRVPALVGRPVRPGADPDVSTSEDSSSLTVTTLLADHSGGVEAWTRRLASNCKLGGDLVEAVSLAGWLHDVGKADSRFQVWLHGGDEVAAAAAPSLLAKSDTNPRNRPA